jgi:probable rRNA maturation factor
MTLKSEQKDLVIHVTITDDSTIQKLNKSHLNRDYTTDVLSFNYGEDISGSGGIFGEIIVNRDQAQRQASEYGNDVEHEIAELVEHGILHLLGVHHPDDDEKTIHGIRVEEKK